MSYIKVDGTTDGYNEAFDKLQEGDVVQFKGNGVSVKMETAYFKVTKITRTAIKYGDSISLSSPYKDEACTIPWNNPNDNLKQQSQ